MSVVKANTYQDASGGSNAVFSGVASPPNSMGFRNRIINGDMRIDQRNAGAEVNPAASGSYYLDRWIVQSSQTSKFKIGQSAGAVTPPAGFTKYLGCTSLSDYSVVAADAFNIQQRIEGLNVADLAWGTASAVAVTLSFWVRSSLTGTFGGSVQNSASDRSYPFSYTVFAANTWEQKTVVVAGDTTGTWVTDSGVGARLFFSLGVGTTQSGTAGAWAAGNFRSTAGATSVVGTNGATFYITGVQLEAGTVASPFERRDYGRELMMCQRYYQRSVGSNVLSFDSYNVSGASCYVLGFLPVAMRTTPTGSFSAIGDFGFSNTNSGNFAVLGRTSQTYAIGTDASASARCQWYTNNANAAVMFSAEL